MKIEVLYRRGCKLLRKIRVSIYSFFFTRKNDEIKKLTRDWNYYCYLKKEYSKILKESPKRKGTHQYSNKVWWCWLQGEENAPALNKACLKSLRKHLKDRDIVVITLDNMKDYVTFPDFILEKYQKGIISNAHLADMLRLELLIKYGGTWIDSSVYCTGYDKSLFDRDLFVFNNGKRGDCSSTISNWFITAEKENPILIQTRDLIYAYWKKENYLLHYFFFHMFFTMVIEKYPDEWAKVPFISNIPPHLMQDELLKEFDEERFEILKKMSSFHKLSQKIDFSQAPSNSLYDKIIKE